jgi:dihydroxy-acid dehydratase
MPFEVNTIAVCDGIAMNHPGMRFSLPSRELIADSVEIVAQAHAFDALVFIPNCDKVVPGMLMAALRLNVPAIFVSGGPMLAGRLNGQPVDVNSVFVAVGAAAQKKMTPAELTALEKAACPGCGSCAGMFTANTMNCLTEALGMALPGNGTIPAVDSRRVHLARKAGEAVVRLLQEGLCPRDIITKAAIYNTFVVDTALGGSTNSILHLMAIAQEAGVDFSLTTVNEISSRTPHLCKLSPSGEYRIEDFDRAGGVPALMKEVRKHLDLKVKRVSGLSLTQELAAARNQNADVIRHASAPYSPRGGLSVLFGNLAPEGAVVKSAAVAPEMLNKGEIVAGNETIQRLLLDIMRKA